MIDKESITKMVQEQVAAKLAGDKTLASQPADTEKKPTPDVKPLDEVDVVKLDNFLLKQEVERLEKTLEDRRREQAEKQLIDERNKLQAYLIEKYNVDVETHSLVINAQARTLTITPRELGTDN